MKIQFVSDLHNMHRDLIVQSVDMIIVGGDVSNPKSPALNEEEVLSFFEWFERLEIKHKVWIAGNHDTSIEHKLVKPKEIQETTIYLEHETVVIEGIKIFGSPYTPVFGTGWSYNVRRDRLHDYWQQIPEDTDILVTHGPPKGILDLVERRDECGGVERIGCKALMDRVAAIQPKIHCFGHIHDHGDCMNKGLYKYPALETQFINASCVTDKKFHFGLTSHGIVLDYEKKN